MNSFIYYVEYSFDFNGLIFFSLILMTAASLTELKGTKLSLPFFLITEFGFEICSIYISVLHKFNIFINFVKF